MGYRAHIVKPGSVDEYIGNEYFNRMECEILELFDNYNIQHNFGYFKRKTTWTIQVAELNALIAHLEVSPNEVDECFLEEGKRVYTNQEAADIFKEWVKYADQESGLVRIHWF